jgi:hypothetical protein
MVGDRKYLDAVGPDEARDLRGLGALRVGPGRAGMYLEGGLAMAYRVRLWPRFASRVLWPLARDLVPRPERVRELTPGAPLPTVPTASLLLGTGFMPVLNIRNLPAEVHARLRIRAAEAHRSMEAEARAILTEACSSTAEPRPANELPDWVEKLYGRRKPADVVDALFAERRRESQRE